MKNPTAQVQEIKNGWIVTTQEAQDVPPVSTHCVTLEEVKWALEAYYRPSGIVAVKK